MKLKYFLKAFRQHQQIRKPPNPSLNRKTGAGTIGKYVEEDKESRLIENAIRDKLFSNYNQRKLDGRKEKNKKRKGPINLMNDVTVDLAVQPYSREVSKPAGRFQLRSPDRRLEVLCWAAYCLGYPPTCICTNTYIHHSIKRERKQIKFNIEEKRWTVDKPLNYNTQQ